MPCAICSQIPDQLTANTGREHYLPETTTPLQPLGWGSRDEDLWKCPQCDNLYTYYSEQAFTGSGNNDEDVLTRLTPEQAGVVRAFAIAGTGAADAREEDAFFALPPLAHSVALSRAYQQNREVVRRLIPRIVAELARTSSFQYRDTLIGLGKARKDDARRIIDEIRKLAVEKGQPLDWVRQQCEASL
ncbi:MAG TPA: hypothetical protein VMZ53_02410 [Kofleriaceae bacterium]|nr:hypothetical protein [Kofleriaceae bacterium]